MTRAKVDLDLIARLDLIVKTSEDAFDAECRRKAQVSYADRFSARLGIGTKEFNANMQKVADTLTDRHDIHSPIQRLRSELVAVYCTAKYYKEKINKYSNEDLRKQVENLEEKYDKYVNVAKKLFEKMNQKDSVRDEDRDFLQKWVAMPSITRLAAKKASEAIRESESDDSYKEMQILNKPTPHRGTVMKLEASADEMRQKTVELNGKQPQVLISKQTKNVEKLLSLKANPKIKALVAQIENKRAELQEDIGSDTLAKEKYDLLDNILNRMQEATNSNEYLSAVNCYTNNSNMKMLDTARKFWYKIFCMKADTGDLVRDLDKEVKNCVQSIHS